MTRAATRIAALFVDARGVYAHLPDVECWTEESAQQSLFSPLVERDARRYSGPYPVVAHPPCSRWCRLAGLIEARWGYRRGDDGGCFEAALRAVRTWGGVLEHPAYSGAWAAFDLPHPTRDGGWVRGACGGYACHVEQGRYGHPAKKATWLYAWGAGELPDLRWGFDPDVRSAVPVSWCGNRTKSGGEMRPRVGARAGSRTPEEFRDQLIAIARSVYATRAAGCEAAE